MRKKGKTKVRNKNEIPSKSGVKKKRVVKRKLPLTRNGGTWTEADYFVRLRAALRKAFRFWTPMQKALEKASRPYRGPNKLQKKEYKCAKCGNYFKRTQVQIDHITECGVLRTYDDIVPFLQRLTPESEDAFQILCINDHKTKTKAYMDNKKKIK